VYRALYIPAQSIYSCASSGAVWEGREGTGKLRQRTISKEKFNAPQKISILTAQDPWQGMRVSQPKGSISTAVQGAQGLCKAPWGQCFEVGVFLAVI